MRRYQYSGFTLIELLVVIGIIGILSSIVLSSLVAARNRAKDASIKDALSSVRTEAASEYVANGAYLFRCVVSSQITSNSPNSEKIYVSVNKYATGGYCSADATHFILQDGLNAGGYFCVDSFGGATTSPFGVVPGATHC